jgi:molybdopterin/thiamine biosynthesis adenylyltransferase
METKTAALVGLGSLGAPLALELGRAQLAELRILDHDLVEAGTTVRWPVGLPAVGSSKTAVIQATITNHFPRMSCQTFQHRIGAASSEDNGAPNDFDLLDRLVDAADLVIDATAEIGVQHLLADLARERSLPQVYVWGTEGAYGGAVVRCLPGETGCWLCLQLAIEDDSIPAPPFEPGGTTQPRGCGTRTFTGESFNLLPLVAQAARVATGTLLEALPPGEDAFVMSLRNGDRPAAAPRWSTYALTKHPRCPFCAAD